MASRKSSRIQTKKANIKTTHEKTKQTKKNFSAKKSKKSLTQEQKAARARDSMRKRLRRANLSVGDLLKLREKEAVQKRIYREKYQTEKQKAAEQARDCKRKRMQRAALSVEDLLQLRYKEALEKKKRRESLTYKQLDEIRSKDVERKRLERLTIGVRKTNDSYVTKRKVNRKPVERAAKAVQNNANKKPVGKVKFS